MNTYYNKGFYINSGQIRNGTDHPDIGFKDNYYYRHWSRFDEDGDKTRFRVVFDRFSDANYSTIYDLRYFEVYTNYTEANGTVKNWSFTGKHICTVELDKIMSNENLFGLIVESTSQYMNFSSMQPNQIVKPSIDDSVPIVTLSKQDKSKKVFGVISVEYDKIANPHLGFGFNYTSIYQNEKRHEINSIGEGGIWICNKNGPFENGDFITSSTVPGYGMVQDDDLNHNYTVGKITCDCDFSLTKVKQSELVYTLDASDNKILTYDEKGHVQYKDLVDESGNVIYDYPLMTRFVQADGTIIEDQTTYESKKAANEEVYIACFVGCVYMCG